MADTEIKKKGRPRKREAEVVEAPSKKTEVSNGDSAAPPAKRGRGRPPKAGTAAPRKPKVPGRGRGRPPKKTVSKKKKKEESEDEDNNDDDKKESSVEADSS